MDTKKLRQKILDLAIRGKLVPQDPNDEPASVLIEKIRAEKEQLIKEKKIKRDKNESYIYRSDKSYYEKFADGTVKFIDDEIPFEIPESWETVRFGDFCFLKAGQFISAKDINKKYNSQLNPCYGGNGLRGYVETYTHAGDFALIGRQGALCGNVNYVSGKFHATEHAVVVQNFGSYINSKWLYYTLVAMNLNQHSAGAAQPGLNVSMLNRLCISIPPRIEQNRIVEKIDFAFALIGDIETDQLDLIQFVKTTKSKILDLAIRGKLVPQDPNDEPASVLLERIKAEHPESKKNAKNAGDNSHYQKLPFEIPENWLWTRFQDIFNIIMGQSPSGKYISSDGKYEFHQGKTHFGDKILLSSHTFTSYPTKLAQSHSLLLCVRAPVGDINITNREICIGRGLCSLKPLNEISLDFAYYWVSYFKNIFVNKATGTTFLAISSEAIRNEYIPIPPLKEQLIITQTINSLYTILDNITAEL
ncbi:restriction endonuclease subunit S [Chryseobacterium sp. C3]|uniref:restriction endonuclease subunit S n=1 Tax=Chryseobacterium sp. C3 TaxID=2761532 RepID=UPI001629B7E2|nr:restriction endonuclease subunit S [Chryseobacterium sp. C3]